MGRAPPLPDVQIGLSVTFRTDRRYIFSPLGDDAPVLDLLKAVRETRDLASRARKLAEMSPDQASKDRIRRYAEELDQRADELEKEVARIKRPPNF